MALSTTLSITLTQAFERHLSNQEVDASVELREDPKINA